MKSRARSLTRLPIFRSPSQLTTASPRTNLLTTTNIPPAITPPRKSWPANAQTLKDAFAAVAPIKAGVNRRVPNPNGCLDLTANHITLEFAS